ncbi:hypothetical protein B0I33_102597 [Prauserella shujinwangii]|uniref:Copper(I)-binding protein n=1 Tax=Prauserella shujinwangii TaxID=1453103 RepID=A0A2T0M1L3_9PSEU|nr:copper chaperone PCu(A)C [Prauserella shujinwangii]PRX50475.1 hypothetical protein B0I33_102597 [Prauserella shujinwangii]
MTQRRRVGAAAFGCAAAVVLAGCSAGQITQTDTMEAAVNGAMATADSITVRDAELLYPEDASQEGASYYPAGSDAEAEMVITNQGLTDDQLVSARSQFAQQVVIDGERTIPGQGALTISPVETELDSHLHAEMTLQGLTYGLRPGETIQVTLVFREAGSVTLDMPIAAPAHPREEEHGGGAEEH